MSFRILPILIRENMNILPSPVIPAVKQKSMIFDGKTGMLQFSRLIGKRNVFMAKRLQPSNSVKY